MLTISPIKNSGGAAIYYTKEDNYYLSELDAKEASQWWGIGADKLGLGGKKVAEKDLQKLMEGRLPNGVTIGLQKDGSIKHRIGHNLCFQAPKSVSILALAGDDKRFNCFSSGIKNKKCFSPKLDGWQASAYFLHE